MKIILEYIIAVWHAVFSRKVRIRVLSLSRINNKCHWGGYNSVGRNCILENCEVGVGTYMGNNCVFTNATIGRYCSISSNVDFITGTHPSRDYISTHPAFFSISNNSRLSFVESNSFTEHKKTKSGLSLQIGNDVWIGNHVCLLEGVEIGDGAIIAAGSVVTKDVLPYTIVGGVPAKIIRKRFDDSDIQELLRLKWWNWDFDKIKKYKTSFCDIKQFIKAVNNDNSDI